MSPCALCMWSKSTQEREKVTQPLLLAQPASALKLCQVVIINEETWANGQEMQRYWLGWLPCYKPYRLAPAWWPVVSQAAVCRAGDSQGVKPGHCWQLSVTSRPHLKDTGDRMWKKKRILGDVCMLLPHQENLFKALNLHKEVWCRQRSWDRRPSVQVILKYLS